MKLVVPQDRAEALLAVLGAALVLGMLALIWSTRGLHHGNATTIAAVLPLILWLAVPTAALLLAGQAIARMRVTPFAWGVVILTGLAMRLLWLGHTPPLEDDYYRYLWDGALVAHGLDPYRHAPEAFLTSARGPASHAALAARARDVIEHINFNDMRTIYPGTAQAVFALAHLIAPFKLDGLRLVFLAGELVTLGLLVTLLKELALPPLGAALYWCNPFAAVMTVGLAHVDALIPPLVLGALLAHARDRPIAALVLLGLAAGVKVWPVMLAPILLWPLLREPRRLLLGCLALAATLAIVMGPVLISTLQPGSGLTAYAGSWSNNNAFYSWVVHGLRAGLGLADGAERGLRAVLAIATGLAALALAVRGDTSLRSLSQRFMIVAATVFYLSPAQFPWYALWFLPLATLLGCRPLLLASALLPFYYLFFPYWPMEQGRLFFYGMAFIHSVPVLGWLLLDAIRTRRTQTAKAC